MNNVVPISIIAKIARKGDSIGNGKLFSWTRGELAIWPAASDCRAVRTKLGFRGTGDAAFGRVIRRIKAGAEDRGHDDHGDDDGGCDDD